MTAWRQLADLTKVTLPSWSSGNLGRDDIRWQHVSLRLTFHSTNTVQMRKAMGNHLYQTCNLVSLDMTNLEPWKHT